MRSLSEGIRRTRELIAEERDVVDGKGGSPRLPSSQWTVLEAAEHVTAHRDLDEVCLEVGQGCELALNELLDRLSGVPCRRSETVEVLAKDAGLDGAEAIILYELEAAHGCQVVLVQACLHQHRERFGVGLCVRRPVVRETDLDLAHQRSLLQLEQDPVLVAEGALQAGRQQAVLVGALVAGPVHLAVGTSGVTTCIVVCEHQVLVGQLGEHQNWRLVDHKVLPRLLRAALSSTDEVGHAPGRLSLTTASVLLGRLQDLVQV